MKRFAFFLLIAVGIAAFSAAQTSGSESFRQEGIASWYGEEFDGKPTASGEVFNSKLFTAAHPTLPFGTVLTITNKQNNRRVTVRINDRGPFVAARIIDLSKAAAEVLDMLTTGTAPVLAEQALDTALGPAGEAAPTVASTVTVPVPASPPIQPAAPILIAEPTPAPAPVVVATAELLQAVPQETIAAEPVAPQATFPTPQAPRAPAETPTPPQPLSAPVVSARPAEAMFPAPPAVIKGSMPPAGSTKLYRLQVGAFRVPRNAVDAFVKLESVGLNPAYEKTGDLYRVVLAGLRAEEIQSIAQKLGNAGFREALIREEGN